MKRFVFVLAATFAVLSFTMCSNNGNIPIESYWEVENIYSNGVEIPIPDDHNATIAFLKDSKIAGDSGCNRFFGDFTVEGKNMSFKNIGSTRMMCPQMQFENGYMQILSNTKSYNISQSKMMLMDENGDILAILSKIEPVAMEK